MTKTSVVASRLRTLKSAAATRQSLRNRLRINRLDSLSREVARLNPATILEVGVWRGDTAERFIRAVGRPDLKYFGVDLFLEEHSQDRYRSSFFLTPDPRQAVLDRLLRLGASVELFSGDSNAVLPSLSLPPIDVAFIDGGHSYQCVKGDWSAIKSMMSPNGVVYFDDVVDPISALDPEFGVNRLVSEIAHDDPDWTVELLDSVDAYRHGSHVLRTRVARARRRGTP